MDSRSYADLHVSYKNVLPRKCFIIFMSRIREVWNRREPIILRIFEAKALLPLLSKEQSLNITESLLNDLSVSIAHLSHLRIACGDSFGRRYSWNFFSSWRSDPESSWLLFSALCLRSALSDTRRRCAASEEFSDSIPMLRSSRSTFYLKMEHFCSRRWRNRSHVDLRPTYILRSFYTVSLTQGTICTDDVVNLCFNVNSSALRAIKKLSKSTIARLHKPSSTYLIS